jgi:pseudouridine synthase
VSGEKRTIDRWLSRRGACSREMAKEHVLAGRVKVDGRVVRDPGAWIDEDARVELDGRLVERAPRVVLMLHKPTGCVTTRSDPAGRPTVHAHLSGAPAFVSAVGRLDLDTSGLLLFTNDNDLADLLTDPASHVEKHYRVEARPRLTDEQLRQLASGPRLSDGPTRPCRVEKLGDAGPATRFVVVVTEGRNRQVRRMVAAVGAKVSKLRRVRLGPLELGDLERGQWRLLSESEVEALEQAARLARRRGRA